MDVSQRRVLTSFKNYHLTLVLVASSLKNRALMLAFIIYLYLFQIINQHKLNVGMYFYYYDLQFLTTLIDVPHH